MSKYNQKPFTAEEKRKAIDNYAEKIQYSARYSSDEWEYRHVIIPKQLLRFVPPGVCPEDVWRSIGIKQSPGWEMYMRHDPEPVRVSPIHSISSSPSRCYGTRQYADTSQHVLLFRRPKNYDQLHPPFAATTAARLVNFAKK